MSNNLVAGKNQEKCYQYRPWVQTSCNEPRGVSHGVVVFPSFPFFLSSNQALAVRPGTQT